MKISSAILLLLAVPAFAAPSRPFVVLIPGAGSSGAEVYVKNIPPIFGGQYFGAYQSALTQQGIDNFVCPKTPDDDTRSIEEREDECALQILSYENEHGGCAQRDVVILGHSMGGLVARELAQDLRVQSCIKTILTVSTPHQGTVLADFAIDHALDSDHTIDFYGWIAKLIGFTPSNLKYLAELRVDRAGYPTPTFNAQDIPDNPAVRYFSISSSFNDWLNVLEIPRQIIADQLDSLGLNKTAFGDRNDGIVPEYSQVHGTYLGHLEVNHWESACVDLVKSSSGCAQAEKLIIPFLASQTELR